MQVFPEDFKEAEKDPIPQERQEIYDKIMAGSVFTFKNGGPPLLMELVNRFPTTLELRSAPNTGGSVTEWTTAKSLRIDEHAISGPTTEYRVVGFPNNV